MIYELAMLFPNTTFRDDALVFAVPRFSTIPLYCPHFRNTDFPPTPDLSEANVKLSSQFFNYVLFFSLRSFAFVL